MATRWAVVIGVLLSALARPAQGSVVVPPELVHASPLPANGVLLIQPGNLGEPVTLEMSGPDGAVAGSVEEIEAFFGWRAKAPPAPGNYEYVLGDDTYFTTASGDLTIVDAYQPEAHELNLALVLENAEVFGGEMVCCGPDPETRTLDSGCFYTEVTQRPELHVFFASPLAPVHANQYLYRIADAPETAERSAFDTSYLARTPALDQARVVASDEYCVTIEALSLIDRQKFLTTACVPHTLPEPTLSPRTDYLGAFSVLSCPEPPEGFEDE